MPSSSGQVGKAVISLTSRESRIFRRNRGHGPWRYRTQRAEDNTSSHFSLSSSASVIGIVGPKVPEMKREIKEAKMTDLLPQVSFVPE